MLDEDDRKKWDGYTFTTHQTLDVIPPFPFTDNSIHPPMMVNTNCKELQETANLKICDLNSDIFFVSTKHIGGSEVLLAEYGGAYEDELEREREVARAKKLLEEKARKNISHSYKCPKCDHRCQPRHAMKHFKHFHMSKNE